MSLPRLQRQHRPGSCSSEAFAIGAAFVYSPHWSHENPPGGCCQGNLILTKKNVRVCTPNLFLQQSREKNIKIKLRVQCEERHASTRAGLAPSLFLQWVPPLGVCSTNLWGRPLHSWYWLPWCSWMEVSEVPWAPWL